VIKKFQKLDTGQEHPKEVSQVSVRSLSHRQTRDLTDSYEERSQCCILWEAEEN